MQGRSFRQNQNQDRIWLLAGTGDGPRLAAALGRHGWQVTVSVVKAAASVPTPGLVWNGSRSGLCKGQKPSSGPFSPSLHSVGLWMQRIRLHPRSVPI